VTKNLITTMTVKEMLHLLTINATQATKITTRVANIKMLTKVHLDNSNKPIMTKGGLKLETKFMTLEAMNLVKMEMLNLLLKKCSNHLTKKRSLLLHLLKR